MVTPTKINSIASEHNKTLLLIFYTSAVLDKTRLIKAKIKVQIIDNKKINDVG